MHLRITECSLHKSGIHGISREKICALESIRVRQCRLHRHTQNMSSFVIPSGIKEYLICLNTLSKGTWLKKRNAISQCGNSTCKQRKLQGRKNFCELRYELPRGFTFRPITGTQQEKLKCNPGDLLFMLLISQLKIYQPATLYSHSSGNIPINGKARTLKS